MARPLKHASGKPRRAFRFDMRVTLVERRILEILRLPLIYNTMCTVCKQGFGVCDSGGILYAVEVVFHCFAAWRYKHREPLILRLAIRPQNSLLLSG